MLVQSDVRARAKSVEVNRCVGLYIVLPLTHYISLPNSSNVLFKCFQDCVKAIEGFFNEKLFIIGYVGLGIAGIMVRI